ncbi:MAG: tripartite tricarboxylate transporter substrate binding protein [Burkholderiaceae bacterium]|nr:tripartite tricarboxylate transporter substrate binding protein [Burkholderiaceae bacterium]
MLPRFSRRALLGALVAGAALGSVSAPVFAQSNWPTKPIKFIVPFPAGGGTDAFARPLSKVLTSQLGQSIVIDNRGGGGGTIGAEAAAKSAPDGYTFLVGAVHHTIAVSLYPKLGYDLQKDLMPVTLLSSVPNVIVVNPSRVPVKNYAEFLKFVKDRPGKLNFGSAGSGTTHQLIGEMFKGATGTFITHIPYRGAGPAMADLLAGQIDMMFDGLGSSAPHIKTGKLTAIAVTTEKRSFALPDVPTLAELGLKGFDGKTWYAIWAPAGTPREVVNRMQQEVAKALQTKELQDAWKNLGADAGGQSPEEFGRLVSSEVTKWAKVVKDSGAKID